MAQAPQETNTDKTPDRDEIPPTQRKKAKKRDNHRCQLCLNQGPEVGGDTPLNVHHKSYNPDECELHDLPNLITLCKGCHDWHHNKPDAEELPVAITDAAADKMKPIDYDILYALHDAGPLTPDGISERIQPNNTSNAIIERLWQIMGMDNRVNEQSQLIDQDAETDEWGLPEQIETSKRGIPTQIKTLVKRIHDALIVDALARGCSRETVANAFGIYRRTTYRIEKRGLAYDFPLKQYTGAGRPKEDDYLIVDLSDIEFGEEPRIQQMVDTLTKANGDSTNANGDNNDTTTAKIAKREQGQVPVDPDSQYE